MSTEGSLAPKMLGSNVMTITKTVRYTAKPISTAVSSGLSASPLLRSIVPSTLLKNATAAYTTVRKSNVAADLSAMNWALGMTIATGLGVAIVRNAHRTPPIPTGLDASRWRKLLHSIRSWLHQKLKSNCNLRRELEDARRAVQEEERQQVTVIPRSAMTEDQVERHNNATVNAIALGAEIRQMQAENVSLHQQLEASAHSEDELMQSQAEIDMLRKELQARDKAHRDELRRLHKKLAVAKPAKNTYEELDQLVDEELEAERRADGADQRQLDWTIIEKGLDIKASPPLVPSSPLLPSSSVSENEQVPIVSTPRISPTPSSSSASGKRPGCTASIERKLESLNRLISSANSSANSKRPRDFDDAQDTPVPSKKARRTCQSDRVFTPGGRPSIKLRMPRLKPNEATLWCQSSRDNTLASSSKNEKAIQGDEADMLVTTIKIEPEESLPKSQEASRPSSTDNHHRRSNTPALVNSPVRRSTRLAGNTKDLSEKALRERSASPQKTTTARSKARSQSPTSSKPTGVTKTPARQTRSVSPKKMDAVKSAAALPKKRN
ncbi:hypothetical protein GMOD_00001162 [Pyrenophora seminiperda CCB06]|uniref:Uncharacterized protein n=1 Tax=Pyrenophora seminiperda CCB06 TaxID=1302712 RepID=A0A3M7LYE7_9PLEO|nr:hypothetical protein GMOD_00001162 [Pyrenophora seminiperda CCB06]